jgi:hypothetical protein
MSRTASIGVLLLGLVVGAGAAWFVRSPGYMDADYYFATARWLARGHGLTEPFIWNYLDDPSALPAPSHRYWMPLTSLVAAVPLALLRDAFRAGQLPFVLFTAALPLLTARLSLRFRPEARGPLLAGALAAFPGFYLPFFVTTDAFSLYAVLGAAALWSLVAAAQRQRARDWLLAGALIALCHLARADGLVLFLPALAAAASARRPLRAMGFLVVGYAVLSSGWWWRNWTLAGAPLPPGPARTLWLLEYDELFIYPAQDLTPARWWSAGLGKLIEDRWWALRTNLTGLVAVNGLVFLLPLMAAGAWAKRGDPLVRLALIYLAGLLAVMSLAFPFPGARGGFFHSSAALMPALWALTPVGLHAVVEWGARHRPWEPARAYAVFGSAAVALAAGVTIYLFYVRVVGPDPAQPRWSQSERTYRAAAVRLGSLDPAPGVVAVNNPPGFYLATNLPAVVIPDGPPQVLHQVVDRYRVDWVVLDANRPEGLAGLYDEPSSVPWLALRASLADAEGRPVHLFQVVAVMARR